MSESEALIKLKGIMSKNKVLKSFIGMGYYETIVPGVIQRNVRTKIFYIINISTIKHILYIYICIGIRKPWMVYSLHTISS